jgi:acylphosphatase
MLAYLARFEGIVQHVHFRVAVRQSAIAEHVHGWVQNQRDGSVLMHAEGPNAKRLIQALARPNAYTNAIPILTDFRCTSPIGLRNFTILETQP